MGQAICTESGPISWIGTESVVGCWSVTSCGMVGSDCCGGSYIGCRGGSKPCGHSAAVGDGTLERRKAFEGRLKLDTTILGVGLGPTNWLT